MCVYMFQPSALAGGGYPDRLGGCPGSRHVGRVLQACRPHLSATRQAGPQACYGASGMVLQAGSRQAAGSNRQAAGRQQADSRQAAGRQSTPKNKTESINH